MPFPTIPGCEDCMVHGRCVCWTDADQREFEKEWRRPLGCTHFGLGCDCVEVANAEG